MDIRFLALLLIAQVTPDANAQAAIALAQAQQAQQAQQTPSPPAPKKEVAEKFPAYADALADCKRTGRPLVVFIGIPARPIPGVISANEPGLWRGETWVTRGILISTDGKYGRWFTPDATDEQIRDVIWPPRRVAPESIPRLDPRGLQMRFAPANC